MSDVLAGSPDLRATLSDLPVRRGHAPWAGYEYVKGWGVFALPFDSGHVLALRVFPENAFAPYASLWHRDPQGRWSIYVDGPRLDTACPRYFGAACGYTGRRQLDLHWVGPATLHVRMESPSVDWLLTATQTPTLALLNAIHGALPMSTWRSPALIGARERMVRGLGMGRLEMSGTMPGGQTGTLMPQRIYFVNDATATIDGHDLGRPTRLRTNPTIGDVPLPARGVLAIGQGVWQIVDQGDYLRTRSETAAGE
jgi:hypothetical protein